MEILDKIDRYYGEMYSCKFYKVATVKMFSQNHLRYIEVNDSIISNIRMYFLITHLNEH